MSTVEAIELPSASAFDEAVLAWRSLERGLVPREWFDWFTDARADEDRLRVAGRWLSGSRSLMGALGLRSKEVQHSQILGWLLDGAGRHGLGTTLLERFLQHAGLHDVRLAPARVELEVTCYDHEDGVDRFVDVVVWGPDWTLVIENKVWSDQHGRQLDVYFDALNGEATRFIYLTPEGRTARSRRTEVSNAWIPMSWRGHVLPMLSAAVGPNSEFIPTPMVAAADYLHALEEVFR